MARFEVVVREVTPTLDEIRQHPETAGLPLSTILERTGGEYVWNYRPSRFERESWLETARLIEDRELEQVVKADVIPVSLEHLRGKDPESTRIKVRFEILFTSSEEGVRFGRADDPRFR